jgi:anoctamin-10
LPYLVEFNVSHEHKTVDFQRLRDQLVYFVVTGQLVGFLTEMVVPYALTYIMPQAKKLTNKVTKKDKKIDPATDIINKATVEDEEELKFMAKVYKEVELEEYNIYTDYVEMVIQVRYDMGPLD